MATIGECIIRGWLTKSPPENRTLFGRFLSHKWRERYFILHKPSGSLPKEYALDYYRDHTTKRHVGRIDLEQCEEILSALDSAHYEHLFAVKTRHKQKERTYYLAAHTEGEMNRWVECLCTVCGLADSDSTDPGKTSNPSNDQPDNFTAITSESVRSPGLGEHENGHALSNTQPASTALDDESDIPTQVAPPVPTGRASPSPYQQLSDCHTGDPKPEVPLRITTMKTSASHDSLDSLPDAPPPPPPKDVVVKPTLDTVVRPQKDTGNNSYYQSPPRHYRPNSNEFYDTPPTRPISLNTYDLVPPTRQLDVSGSPQDWYDVPPSANLRHSASMREQRHLKSVFSTSETYDYPRSQRNSADGDVYDTPPPPVMATCVNNNVLGKIPPPPGGGLTRDYHYENLPPNSKSHPSYKKMTSPYSSSSSVSHHPEPPPPPTTDDTYDVPPSHDQWRSRLAHSPPPPTPCSKIAHPYVNSPTGYVDPPVGHDGLAHSYVNTPKSYVDMEGPVENYIPMTKEVSTYIPMNENTPEAGKTSSLPKVFSAGYQDQEYVSQASKQSIKTLDVARKAQLGIPTEESDNYIMPTQRTRSFKRRDHLITKTQPQSLRSHIPLPQRTDRIEESSSDDDDDDTIDNLSEVHDQKSSSKSCKRLSSTPPPPRGGRGEIEYLDLDLKEKDSDGSPAVTRSPTGNTSPTDYKEIDFIKTKALSETRKDLENKRKSSDTG